MEPEGSLLRLQEPTTCPYSEPDESSPPLSKSVFISLPSAPGFCFSDRMLLVIGD